MRLARLAALLLVLAAPALPQGELDGQWLKIKVKARGFTLSEAGVVEKASFSSTVYMALFAEGALKKATLRSESGHVVEGTLDGENSFFGSVTLTGQTVTKLPFQG